MTPEQLLLNPLGPAVVLALGGMLLSLARRLPRRDALLLPGRGGHKSRIALPDWLRLTVALLFVALAAAVWALTRFSAAVPVIRWNWQPLTVAGSIFEWQLNPWNWLVSGLALLLAAVAVVLDLSSQPQAFVGRADQYGAETERTLWLAAAAVVFVSSNTILALAVSWVMLDAALALRLRPGAAAEPAGRAWGFLTLSSALLLLLLALLGEENIRATLTGPGLAPLALSLLWILALIRAGVYPVHFWLEGPERLGRGDAVALSLIAPLAGLWLLVCVHGIAGPDWLRRPEWAALGALGLLGSALVAWAANGEELRWRWIAINRASLAVMAAYTAGVEGPEALAWSVTAFGLGCAFLAVAGATRSMGWRLPAWLAAIVVWGVPGTAAFFARSGLVFPTELPIALPLFAVVVLAEGLLAASLWEAAAGSVPQDGRAEGGSRTHTSGLMAGARLRPVAFGLLLILLLAPILALGLAPQLLARLLGWPESGSFAALSVQLSGLRRSVWIGLASSAVLGIGLGVFRQQIFGQVRGWQAGIVALASLRWLYRMVASVFNFAAGGLQYFATLGEGEGYLGWLALAALILWVLLRG